MVLAEFYSAILMSPGFCLEERSYDRVRFCPLCPNPGQDLTAGGIMQAVENEFLSSVQKILDASFIIEQTQGADDACKVLGNYRRAALLRLPEEPEQVLAICKIVERQCSLFIRLQRFDLCLKAADGMIHLIHDVHTAPGISAMLREPMSRIFLHAARCLAEEKDFAGMRLQIRSALDTTSHLEFCILKTLPLWVKAGTNGDLIEEKTVSAWILDRYAELLAQLDFAGKNGTVFRRLLDVYQRSFREEADIDGLRASLAGLVPESIEEKTLYEVVETRLQTALKP